MRFAPSVRRRLRWIGLATLIALVVYPVSLGPASYFVWRDATPRMPFAPMYHAFYRPLWAVANPLGLAGPLWDYEDYCIRLAAHHDGNDIGPVITPPEPRDDLPE
jgi:hypothetical protein